ncbi:MAG: hypothetical protein KQJ78_20200 [Deltaproteobacteria bacterium]|nr:hypothetical protein [Deltaproteobacteria bacterium]
MLDQVILTGQLETLSPLHVGTGDFTPLQDLFENKSPRLNYLKEDKQALNALVATVVRDHRDKPCLPATALKGCLRAACQDAGKTGEELKLLFGEALDAEEKGVMAKALFRLATLDGLEHYQPPADCPLPLFRPEAGTYIQPRIRVDQNSGTALDKFLFFQEMVPPGARFGLRVVYQGTWEECREKLLPALALLSRPEGISLGKGLTQGNGRLRLAPDSLEAQVIGFDPLSCTQTQTPKTAACLPSPEPPSEALAVDLRLACEGPFLILDPSRPGADSPDQEDAANTLSPVLQKDGRPDLPPSSLLGALRARLAWLCQLTTPEDGDDPARVLRQGQDPGTLTTTERLFGVTGWRGLVRVAGLDVEDGGEACRVPGVALDRFTAEPLQGALFFTHAQAGVKYRVRLALDSRCFGGTDPKAAQIFGKGLDKDETAFCALIADLTTDDAVLMLGHGTNQGFGWFRVEEVA